MGSGATSVRPFCVFLDFVGVVPDLGNHTSPRLLLEAHFIRYVMRSRETGQSQHLSRAG